MWNPRKNRRALFAGRIENTVLTLAFFASLKFTKNATAARPAIFMNS
jgi:hypothetical protein